MTTDRPDEHADLENTADLVERHRVEAIEDARQRVREVRLQTKPATDLGQISPASAELQIARATKAYVGELEYPLANSQIGRQYWEKADLGAIGLEPPPPEEIAWEHKLKNDIGYISPNENERAYGSMPSNYTLKDESAREPKHIDVVGLRTFLDLDAMLEMEHSATFRIRYHGTAEVSTAGRHPIPEHVSTAAYRAVNRFLGDIDLGIDASQDTDDWEV